MILGQSNGGPAPTAANPVPFQPPTTRDPRRPHPKFMSTNFWPFSQVLNPMRSFPAYHPHHGPNVGPHGFPPDATPAAAAAGPSGTVTAAPVPGIATTGPGGTHGFGGAAFGSHGGTKHFHADPYMVMRSGWIPGVDPSGANIRAGYKNAGMRVNRSMPFQMQALAPMPPPPPPPMPAPAATHGFGHHRHHHHHHQEQQAPMAGFGFPGFRRMTRFMPGAGAFTPGMHPHHRHHHHPGYMSQQPYQPYTPPSNPPAFGAPGSDGCEWVGPRVDGISVKICDGRVVSYRDASGNVMTPGDFQGPREGWFMRNFGWRRHHRMA